ncbi:MAG: DNA gyrase inhibitor YacG [Gammaproteobacteria bacterium RIFCSPHIGHO2_12_FULL_42_13]|nr:MAG: DNA gyrase inhibitor YacG [Gammaproteobacteria bacterium RIFCSPHIGHO2_12_FULL_42_13]
MTTNKPQAHCPTCNKIDTWHQDNPFRPFCSERCKLIDLGEWASDSHRIPGERAKPGDNSESEDENS